MASSAPEHWQFPSRMPRRPVHGRVQGQQDLCHRRRPQSQLDADDPDERLRLLDAFRCSWSGAIRGAHDRGDDRRRNGGNDHGPRRLRRDSRWRQRDLDTGEGVPHRLMQTRVRADRCPRLSALMCQTMCCGVHRVRHPRSLRRVHRLRRSRRAGPCSAMARTMTNGRTAPVARRTAGSPSVVDCRHVLRLGVAHDIRRQLLAGRRTLRSRALRLRLSLPCGLPLL